MIRLSLLLVSRPQLLLRSSHPLLPIKDSPTSRIVQKFVGFSWVGGPSINEIIVTTPCLTVLIVQYVPTSFFGWSQIARVHLMADRVCPNTLDGV